MRKPVVMMVVLSAIIVAILALPGWREAGEGTRDGGEGVSERYASDGMVEGTSVAVENSVETISSFTHVDEDLDKERVKEGTAAPEQLAFSIAEIDGGLELRFEQGESVTLLGTESVGDAIVHMTARSSRAGDRHIYDAIVVRPETGEAEAYRLFESSAEHNLIMHASDNNHIWFTKQSLDNEQLSYSLMSLNVRIGGLSALASDFWLVDQRDEAERDDFIMQAYPQYDEQGQLERLMVTTFQGKLWVLPWQGEYSAYVYDSPATYPAFGDRGSKPPRSLVFPSPALDRFVYRFVGRDQILPSNYYMVADTETRATTGLIGLDESMMPMDDGVRWNAEGSLFFLEYAKRDETMGAYSDNSHYLFAQGIDIYNRDGKRVRGLKAPPAKRMNAYGWVDESRLLTEEYTPRQVGDIEWRKENIGYRLYDTESGKSMPLSIVRDASQLKDTVQLTWGGAGYGHDSQSFLLLDSVAGQVWEPGMKGYQWHAHDNVMEVYMDEGTLMYRWNPESRTMGPVYFDREHALRAVAGDWGVFWHRSSDDGGDVIRYARLTRHKPIYTGDGMPQLPASFYAEEPHKWWEQSGQAAAKLEEKQLRVEGDSRYGSLQLTALPGEWMRRNGVIQNYYGNYEVTFHGRNGRISVLPQLDGLELEQDGDVGEMTIISFRNYDVLFYQPKQFSYSTGLAGSESPLYAYAVTESGEAFPLSSRYALLSGEQVAGHAGIVQHRPLRRQGEVIVSHALLDDGAGRHVLEWTTDIANRSLVLTAARSKAVEDEASGGILTHYSLHLAQALRMTNNAFPGGGPMNEERLRALFTDQAWRNPGFQMLRKAGIGYEEEGNPWRAFPWPAIDTELLRQDTIRVTFTFNLINALGKAAHLEGSLKRIDGEWRFYDFGTLRTEDWQENEIMPELDGLLIEDRLEL